MQSITVIVKGGIVETVEGVPAGVEVRVRDYDQVQADDSAEIDENGRPYTEAVWGTTAD